MVKLCTVILDDGTRCGRSSRSAGGLCYAHGGGRCAVEGCGRAARCAGCLCPQHAADPEASLPQKAPRKAAEFSGRFVGKRKAEQELRASTAGSTQAELLSAAAVFLASLQAIDALHKVSVLREIAGMLEQLPGRPLEDAVLDIANNWRCSVAAGEKEPWQIFQTALALNDGYPHKLPWWAKRPCRQERPTQPLCHRLFGVLRKHFGICHTLLAVLELIGDEHPAHGFFNKVKVWHTLRSDFVQTPGRAGELVAIFKSMMENGGLELHVILRVAYRLHVKTWYDKRTTGRYPSWARPPFPVVTDPGDNEEHDVVPEDIREDGSDDQVVENMRDDGGAEDIGDNEQAAEKKMPSPWFPVAADSDSEYEEYFDDPVAGLPEQYPRAAAVAPAQPAIPAMRQVPAVPAPSPADLEALRRRLSIMASALPEDRMDCLINRLLDEGLSIDDSGDIDIELLSSDQRATLTTALERAFAATAHGPICNQPLMGPPLPAPPLPCTWPEKQAAGEPAPKKARLEESGDDEDLLAALEQDILGSDWVAEGVHRDDLHAILGELALP